MLPELRPLSNLCFSEETISGLGRPRFSLVSSPSYSRRKRPRRCSSGTTDDEVVESGGQIGEHHVKAVTRFSEEPFLHLIGDCCRRANKCEPPVTADTLC